MAKHCIFEHFLRFVKQNQPKPSVVVTLQDMAYEQARKAFYSSAVAAEVVLSSLDLHTAVKFFKPQKK